MGFVPVNSLTLILVFSSAFAAVFLQSAFDLTRWLAGAQINLLPALMVYAALTCELPAIVLLAIVGGLLFDSLSADPLGTMVIALFLPAWVIYLKRGLILRRLFFARLVLGWIATGATPIIALLILLSAREQPLLGWRLLWQWALLTFLGGLATPAIMAGLDALRKSLSYETAPVPSFRANREIRRGRH